MRKTQSVATLVSLAVTVAVLFALILTYSATQAGLKVSQERLGADLLVVPSSAASEIDETALLFSGSPAPFYMNSDIAKRIQATKGVQQITTQFYGQTLDSSCCSASEPARLIGFDAKTDWTIAPWTQDAQLPQDGLSDTQVIVGSNVDGVSNGVISVLGRNFYVASRLSATGTDLDGSILMNINMVRSLTSENVNFSKYWNKYGEPSTLVSAVLVKLTDGADAADVAGELSKISNISVVQPSNVMENASNQLNAIFKIMLAAALLMAIATVIQIFARFFGIAWDRRAELALYRALGASRGRVSKLISFEAFVLLGAGFIVGLVLGIVLYLLVPSLIASAGDFPYIAPSISVWILTVVGLLVFFALLTFIAVAVPVKRSNRIDPSVVLQAGDIE